jgi:hypothetical protein
MTTDEAVQAIAALVREWQEAYRNSLPAIRYDEYAAAYWQGAMNPIDQIKAILKQLDKSV